jgi:putative flippase GtrA
MFVPERYRPGLKQFLKFAVTGAIGAVVDFGTYALLTRGLHWNSVYHVLGYTLSAPNSVSVFFAIVSNFLFNKFWTFRTVKGNFFQQWAGYFALNLFTWALNQILVGFFAFHVPLFAQLFGDLKDFAAKALAIGLILFVNFGGSKMLVFRKKRRVAYR